MKPLHISGGQIHAPYFIFIDGGTIYSDDEVLELLGIDGFTSAEHLKFPNHFLHITDDGRWLHVIDDWLYTQWHSPSIRERLTKLASQHDIFTCSVGDSDHSFDFDYYKDGGLVRRYVVEDPSYDGGHVTEDFGVPLLGEEEAFRESDELKKVMSVARSIGIEINHIENRVRSFTKPYERPSYLQPKTSLLRRLLKRT